MPTFANIKVSVVSQFELATLPEHILPNTAEDKFRRYSGPAAMAPLPTPTSPFVAGPTTSPVITLYVPNISGSRFWVDYAISGPQNPNSLYYFQLSVNGSHAVSWGCGEKEGFGGKSMFKILESGTEAALLGYGESAAMMMEDPLRDVVGSKTLDIKVCRAKGRYRVNGDEQGNDMFAVGTGCETGRMMGSVNYFDGFIEKDNSQSMYKYSLLDPLDKPYVTFRYVYKSWNQLEALEVAELPVDQHIDSSLAQFTAPAVVDQGFSFEQFLNHEPFQPVPTTAHSTCSIFVPPTYEYFHLPPNLSQQPTYSSSPGTAQTARSTCSIFLPPPPSPPKSPKNLAPVPEAPSVIVTPPSAQQSYILPVPASAKKGKGHKGSKSGGGSSSSSSGSPSGGGTHIYDSSLPFRLSTPSSSDENDSDNSTIIHNPAPAPAPVITNYQSLLAEQELRIQRATEKGLAWLRAEFPADRPKPMPDPSLSLREVGRQMIRIIGRRTERIEAAKAAKKAAAEAEAATAGEAVGEAAGGAGAAEATAANNGPNHNPDPRGHMMSLITRQNRESLQRAARVQGGWGRGGSLLLG